MHCVDLKHYMSCRWNGESPEHEQTGRRNKTCRETQTTRTIHTRSTWPKCLRKCPWSPQPKTRGPPLDNVSKRNLCERQTYYQTHIYLWSLQRLSRRCERDVSNPQRSFWGAPQQEWKAEEIHGRTEHGGWYSWPTDDPIRHVASSRVGHSQSWWFCDLHTPRCVWLLHLCISAIGTEDVGYSARQTWTD